MSTIIETRKTATATITTTTTTTTEIIDSKKEENNNLLFEKLPSLPLNLCDSQCIVFNEELLICGGTSSRCYSYHTVKRQYRPICEYPAIFSGHAVVLYDVLKDNCNKDRIKQCTLLTFGGRARHYDQLTLTMNYQSVWDKDQNQINDINNINNNNNNNETIIKEHKNVWIISQKNLIDNKEETTGLCALVGGSQNQILFSIHRFNNIHAFNLKTFELLTKDKLPIDFGGPTCFVKINRNTSKQTIMIQFYYKNIIYITYDEEIREFTYECLPMYHALDIFFGYSHIYIKDSIVLLGGFCASYSSRNIYTYSIKDREWRKSFCELPEPISEACVVVNENNKMVHIIGGKHNSQRINHHWAIQLRSLTLTIDDILDHWMIEIMLKPGWIDEFYDIIANYII